MILTTPTITPYSHHLLLILSSSTIPWTFHIKAAAAAALEFPQTLPTHKPAAAAAVNWLSNEGTGSSSSDGEDEDEDEDETVTSEDEVVMEDYEEDPSSSSSAQHEQQEEGRRPLHTLKKLYDMLDDSDYVTSTSSSKYKASSVGSSRGYDRGNSSFSGSGIGLEKGKEEDYSNENASHHDNDKDMNKNRKTHTNNAESTDANTRTNENVITPPTKNHHSIVRPLWTSEDRRKYKRTQRRTALYSKAATASTKVTHTMDHSSDDSESSSSSMPVYTLPNLPVYLSEENEEDEDAMSSSNMEEEDEDEKVEDDSSVVMTNDNVEKHNSLQPVHLSSGNSPPPQQGQSPPYEYTSQYHSNIRHHHHQQQQQYSYPYPYNSNSSTGIPPYYPHPSHRHPSMYEPTHPASYHHPSMYAHGHPPPPPHAYPPYGYYYDYTRGRTPFPPPTSPRMHQQQTQPPYRQPPLDTYIKNEQSRVSHDEIIDLKQIDSSSNMNVNTPIGAADSFAEASAMISFDSLQRLFFVITSLMLLSYCSVSPRTLPLVKYNAEFKNNVQLLILMVLPCFGYFCSVYNPKSHTKNNDINRIVNTFYSSFTVGYAACFVAEMFFATILRLAAFMLWEPDVFKLTPRIPLPVLPWVLRDEGYKPKRITLFVIDFCVSCIAAPIIEEMLKLKLVEFGDKLPANYNLVKRRSSKSKRKSRMRRILEPINVISESNKNQYGNNKMTAKDSSSILLIDSDYMNDENENAEVTKENKGLGEVTDINPYVSQMLAASLGLKLADGCRRILMYTKKGDENRAFYAIFRGLFPIQELCGTMTVLQLAKRNILGINTPLWKMLLPGVVIHAMANFRGKKPIYKWNSATPWTEMQISPFHMEDDSTFGQMLNKGFAKLMWLTILGRVLGYCIKNYYMIGRQARKRATTYAGKPAAFLSELAADEMLKKAK